MQEIGLAEALKAIRDDLARARLEGADEEIRLRVGSVEVEFEVAMVREGGANGQVKVWVVEFGASGKLAQTTRHRVAVTLEPQVDGKPIEVGDRLSEPGR